MDLIVKSKNIDIEYNGKQILDVPELEIYAYDKIGIVGRNGAGKSTLLKILSGQINIENGMIQRFGTISYIPQLERLKIETIADKAILGKLKMQQVKGESISGGEETKFKIAKALSENSDAIFADEPTCHLDEESIQYITNSFKYYTGSLLVVSHDRYFLDEVVNKIWEIKDGNIIEYWGNYTDYLQQKELEKQTRMNSYEQYISEKKRLSKAMENKLQQAQKVGKGKSTTESGGRLSHQKDIGSKEKAIHKSARAIAKRLEALEEIEKPEKDKKIYFKMSDALAIHNSVPIQGENICKKIGDRILFENATFKIPLGSKVAITGANGVGKTTLLNMIIERESCIEVSSKAVIGCLAQNGYRFEENRNVLEYVRDRSDYSVSDVRSIIARMGIEQNVITRTMGTLSGGEVVKLLLCKILLGRYNILMMDEPNNYLDIESIQALEELMKQYKGTIIFVSHDKRLIQNVADIVYEIRDYKIIEKKIEKIS